MAIFSDIELAVMADDIKGDHDRKVSVPVLRDIMTVVEDAIFRRLATPGASFTLGRVCKITVEELDIPDDPRPEDEPAEFYLCAIASADLERAIEDKSDSSFVPERKRGLLDAGLLTFVDIECLHDRELLKKRRRIARGDPEDA